MHTNARMHVHIKIITKKNGSRVVSEEELFPLEKALVLKSAKTDNARFKLHSYTYTHNRAISIKEKEREINVYDQPQRRNM